MSRSRDEQLDRLTQIELDRTHPCPLCRANGTIDYFDFVRGEISLHCRTCAMTWSVPTEAPLSHLSER
jgi:hypothetical protein